MSPRRPLESIKQVLSAADRQVRISTERVVKSWQGMETISAAVAKAEIACTRSKAAIGRIKSRDAPQRE